MKATIYLYPKCGTCRSAVKWLESRGFELTKIDVFEAPPTAVQLDELIALSGLEPKKWFNVSGEVYKEMQLKDKLPGMTREGMLELLASNGRLIKRPVVTDGKRATVGFKEEQFEQVWN